MSGAYLAGLILILFFLLGKVSDFATAAIRRISERFRVNEFIASFFLLGIATSIPELAVAIFSAVHGVPELSLGNLLGANIVVLTLMVGLTALFSGKFSIHRALHKDDFLLSLLITALPIPFVLNGYVSQVEGVLMLVAYGYFLLHFFWRRRAYRRQTSAARRLNSTLMQDGMLFALSVAALLVISYFLVQVSLAVAAAVGIPLLIVGLIMISLGTNVPEASFVINQASRKYAKDRNIAAGILLGNVVANTPVLGLLAFLSPFAITDVRAIWVTSGFLIVVLYALWTLVLSERKLTRREGVILLLLYALFVGYQLGLFSKIFS